MARVPSAEQQVRTAPDRTPFDPGRGISPAAFGAREAMATIRQGQGLVEAGDDLGQISLAIQETENDRVAKDMDNELSQRTRELLYGTPGSEELGFLQKQGQAAVESAPEVVDELENIRKDILARSPNSRVSKDWGLSSRASAEVQLDQVGRWTGAQRVNMLDSQNQSWIQNRVQDGLANALDPVAVERTLSEIRIGLEDQQALLGWTDEEFEAQLENTQGSFQVGVIDRILTGTDPLAALDDARSYFEANKYRIPGGFQSDIEKKLRTVSNQQRSGILRETKEAIQIIESDKDYANLAELETKITSLGPAGEELALALSRAQEDRSTLSEFNQLSIPDRTALVQDLQSQTTLDADQDRILRKQLASLERANKAIAEGNGILLAIDNKLLAELEDLSVADETSWSSRMAQAQVASEGLGVDVGPITRNELTNLSTTLKTGTLDEVTAILNAMVAGGGAEMTDKLAQDLIQDEPGTAAALGVVGEAPDVARTILQGEKRMADNPNLIAPREEVNSEVAELAEGLFDEFSDGETLSSLVAGTLAYMAGSGDPARDIRGNFDTDEFEKAWTAVTGGVVNNGEGRKVLAPVRGMAQNEFDQIQRNVTSDVLVEYGNGSPLFPDGTPVPASILENQGELITTGPGQYVIRIPGQGFIQNEFDQPYEINLGEAIKAGSINRESAALGNVDLAFQRAVGIVSDEQPEDPIITALREERAGPPTVELEPPLVELQETSKAKPSLKPESPSRPGTVTAKKQDEMLLQSIARNEGLRLSTYEDTTGNLTIGYGHKLKKGESFPNGITLEFAKELRRQDIAEAQQSSMKFSWYGRINPARQNVVTEMIFNLGPSGFRGFKKTIEAIRREDWDTAAAEMLDSLWADQVGNRSRELAEQMRSGNFQ